MFKMHVRYNSVIKIFVEGGKYGYSGRVTFLDENEIVVVPQNIIAKGPMNPCGYGVEDLVNFTIDGGPGTHISREKIVGWAYEKFPNDPRVTYHGIPTEDEIPSSSTRSYYDESGICRGIGDPLE